MIPREVLVDLDSKLQKICNHPEFSRKVQDEVVRLMVREANFFSFMMEVSEGESFLDDRSVEERYGSVDDIRTQVNECWEWAVANYQCYLSHDFLQEIARRFEPKNNSGYRRDNVRLKNLDYIPPRWEKVPIKVVEMLQEIATFPHPLQQALYAHFHIARIQPFIDGNKRTARLVQNVILFNNNFPPIVLYGGERGDYLDHFEEGLKGYKTRGEGTIFPGISEGERRFYRYLLGKEVASLESLYTQLINMRSYRVTVDYRERGCMFTLKRMMQNYFAKAGKQGEVRMKGKELTVKGDIGLAKLNELLTATNGYKRCDV
ncbi:MAG: Fic family protein, partial [Nanoarchaeota archaeon]|nr:Fic family protein [Nanoarchaeota archaeon]